MADIYVRNSLQSDKVVRFTLDLGEYVDKGTGEVKWYLTLGTSEKDKTGASINPVILDNISYSSLDKEITNALSLLCNKIDWGPLEKDKEIPVVVRTSFEEDVLKYGTNLYIDVEDALPSSGLDLSEVKFILETEDGSFDVTPDVFIEESFNKATFLWRPVYR